VSSVRRKRKKGKEERKKKKKLRAMQVTDHFVTASEIRQEQNLLHSASCHSCLAERGRTAHVPREEEDQKHLRRCVLFRSLVHSFFSFFQ
jgi:hypothetical protein